MMSATPERGVKNGENTRNEKQRRESRKEQTADNGATQGGILLAAFAKADGHGHHADDHGESGHDDGADADKAGLERGIARVLAFSHLLASKRYHQNAVGGGHAHAHDSAGKRRHVQGGVGNQKYPANTSKSAGQGGDDDERIEPGLKVDDDEQIGEKNCTGKTDSQSDEGVAHRLYLAADNYVAAARQGFFYGGDLLENLLRDGAE